MTPQSQAVAGSPVWQVVFLSFAVVLILFEVVRGWRLGLLRQLIRLAALLAAYAAFFGGKLLVPLARPFFKMPDLVLSALGGTALAFVVYATLSGIGAILFKRTGEQDSRIVQLIYGISGAVVGLFFGVFALWLIVVSVRAVGAVADAQVRNRAATGHASPDATSQALEVRRRFLGDGNEQSAPFAVSLARLKTSLELGRVGNAIKQTDRVSQESYDTLTKVTAVFCDPERARRFLSVPGAREISENPKIVALRDDPEISAMIAQRRFFDLLQDQRIIDAANDPAIANRIKKFDLQRALDYALRHNDHDTNEH